MKSLIQPVTTYDSVCFDLRLVSVTIMDVLIVLIDTKHLGQLTIVSHIRKYNIYFSYPLHCCYNKISIPISTYLWSERLAVDWYGFKQTALNKAFKVIVILCLGWEIFQKWKLSLWLKEIYHAIFFQFCMSKYRKFIFLYQKRGRFFLRCKYL